MDLKKFFEEVGGNYDTVMSRLPGESLIKKFVLKFKNDPSYDNLKHAIAENDVKAAFMAAHTIKGTAANLGLDLLAQKASDLTEELRNATALPAHEFVKALDSAYELTIGKIAELE